jgi:hypothetical protein
MPADAGKERGMKKKGIARKIEPLGEPITINDKASALLACQKIRQILHEYNGMPEDSFYNKLLLGLMDYIGQNGGINGMGNGFKNGKETA